MKFLYNLSLVFLLFTTKVTGSEISSLELNSELSDQQLSVTIYLPSSYNQKINKRYPVFVTTAGKSREKVVLEQVNWLSHVDFAPIPEVIQVVLPSIDLTQTGDKLTKAAGAENKLTAEVLIKEILPAIDNKYRTTGYRIVEGFSSLGNFPLYLLRYYSAEFNAFLVFSPALELDKSGLVRSFSEPWLLSETRRHFVYLSLGTFTGNKPLYLQLSKYLSDKQKLDSFEFVQRDMSKENYLSGPNIGLIHASQLLFSDLQPDYSLFHQGGVSALREYFKQLSDKYFVEIDLASKMIDLSFSYANADQYEQAIKTLSAVIAADKSNVLYRVRMAQIQLQAKNNDEALETLAKARELAQQSKNDEALNYIEQLTVSATR